MYSRLAVNNVAACLTMIVSNLKSVLRTLSLLMLFYCTAPMLYAQNLFSKQMTLQLDGNVRTLYYESNHDINIASRDINRLVIVVHGAGRSNISYERLHDVAIAKNVNDTTFIFAPQFLVDNDIAENSLGTEVLYWPGGWRQGHLSSDNGLGRISSFEVVNQIATGIVTNNPGITNVVIAGHSAGGQYAQRFAATSQLERELKVVSDSIKLRYIPANPSSMVYMDAKRRVAGSVDQFAVPGSENCSGYDDYKYGLGGNLNSFIKSIGGANQVRAQFPSRDVRYLLGENDNNLNSSSLDKSCAANLQGQQRLERGIIFYNYIRDFFGESVHDSHVMAISSDVGHSSSIFTAGCGLSFIFDIGGCDSVAPTHLELTTDNSRGVIGLNWKDRAAGETGYQVERSDDGGASYFLLTTLSSNTNTYDDTNVAVDTQYHYRVRAKQNNKSSAYSNVAIANPEHGLPVSAPPSSTADSSSSGGIGIEIYLILAAVLFTFYVYRKRFGKTRVDKS